jgi:transcriptional regulator with XRE-family HTH domain
MIPPTVVSIAQSVGVVLLMEFARRLVQSCDESPLVPEHGKGRQVYLAKRMKVTQEAVRKWLEGESLPRPDKIGALAKVLDVDPVWLQLGTSPLEIADKRQVALRGDAAVYGVMSYLLLAGYHVALPQSAEERVDIFAIKHGTQLSILAKMGQPLARGEWKFVFPANLNARWHGVVSGDEPSLHLAIYDIPPDLALRHGHRTGSGVEVVLRSARGRMHLADTALRQLRQPQEEN